MHIGRISPENKIFSGNGGEPLVIEPIRPHFFICWITLPADLKNWDLKKKKDTGNSLMKNGHLMYIYAKVTY